MMIKAHNFAIVLITLGSTSVFAYETEARVVNVEPLTEKVVTQDRCTTQNPYNSAAPQKNYTGSIIGAVAGGLLGAQVGRGNGQIAAAAVGAATGAMVGDNLGNSNNSSYQNPSYVCEPSYAYRNVGYRVTYIYDNREYVTNMPYDPGNRLPVSVQITPRY